MTKNHMTLSYFDYLYLFFLFEKLSSQIKEKKNILIPD